MLLKGPKMSETITIKFEKTLPLIDQVSYTKKTILKWTKSLEQPFNENFDVLRLTKCEINEKECV